MNPLPKSLPFLDLVNHLLDNQHRIPNAAIIDTLNIARLNPSQFKPIATEAMVSQLQCSTANGMSMKLSRLKELDLIDYERGNRWEPGYTIFRIGPKVQERS